MGMNYVEDIWGVRALSCRFEMRGCSWASERDLKGSWDRILRVAGAKESMGNEREERGLLECLGGLECGTFGVWSFDLPVVETWRFSMKVFLGQVS